MLTAPYLARFSGVGRLYGSGALERLAGAHVVVVGLGGVGSWAAEALARTGIGELTLIELDEVCVTNTNRQLQALDHTVGQQKIAVMRERLLAINPELTLHCINDFLDKNNMAQVLGREPHVVVDAMDSTQVKAALVAYCSRLKLRLVTCGASGGKRDPGQIRVADLGETTGDALLAKVRSQLYRQHNFAKNKGRKFRVDAVYSPEPMVYPQADGSVCTNKSVNQRGVKLDCAGGFGSGVMVTGSFGFAAAAKAVERILQVG